MDTLLQDLRFAVRQLLKSPGFTLIAAATLALGIGANTAIVSLVSGTLLAPLPYQDPDRLVRVAHRTAEQGVTDASFSREDFADLAAGARGFAQSGTWFYTPGQSGVSLTGGGEPERLDGAYVSAGFFPTLGVGAAVGRTLAPGENVPGADRAVVLSHDLWRRRFGGDPGLVGRTLLLDGQSSVVVGVMPPSFTFPDAAVDLWLPVSQIGEDDIPHLRGLRWMSAVARLAPGVTPQAAEAEAEGVFRRLAAAYPDSNEGWERAAVIPLHEAVMGEVRRPLMVLLAGVALVLVVACANLANLLLARGAARAREVAVRAAIGASRRRLIRQLLTESLVLALVGGAAGLLLAVWGIDVLAAFGAATSDQLVPRLAEVEPDGRTLLVSLALTLATGLLTGLLPALQTASNGLSGTLQEEGRGSAGGRGGARLRSLLVVAETALATLLLVGAGLLLHSFWRLVTVDPGFRSEGVLALSIRIPEALLGEGEDRTRAAAYRDGLLRRLAQIPGVAGVGAAKTLPLAGGGEPYDFHREDERGGPQTSSTVAAKSGAYIVTPGYFEALGIPLLRGRTFSERDGADDLVLLVNQAFARRVWPGQEAVGQRLWLGEQAPFEVVGVVGDVRNDGLAAPAETALYVPSAVFQRSSVKIFVRAVPGLAPEALAAPVRQAIWELDPQQAIADLAPLRQLVAGTVARPRLFAVLLGAFSAAAVALAGLGLYGVIAYGVRRRTREIGVRMALGAGRGAVTRLVVSEGAMLAGAGVVCGLAAAFALARLMRGLLFGIGATDPSTYAAAALLVASVALLASWLPARRAARLDPYSALRAD